MLQLDNYYKVLEILHFMLGSNYTVFIETIKSVNGIHFSRCNNIYNPLAYVFNR